jgi:hypothetical protein
MLVRLNHVASIIVNANHSIHTTSVRSFLVVGDRI